MVHSFFFRFLKYTPLKFSMIECKRYKLINNWKSKMRELFYLKTVLFKKEKCEINGSRICV